MSSPIADRKLVQWTLGYVASAWVILEATGEVSDLLGWPRIVQLVVLVLLLFGLPSALVIAWYHGEKGQQRVTRTEVGLLSVIAVAGVATAFWVARSTPAALEPLEPASGRLSGEDGMDPWRYAVFPLRGEESDQVPALGLLVHDALARWEGIELVDPALLDDALDPEARSITYLRNARDLSQRLGAGRLVIGEAGQLGTELRVRVELRDTRSGRVLADTVLRLTEDAGDADSVVASAADALLLVAEGLSPGVAGRAGTRSFPARVAFLEGMQRLDEWRLDEAIRSFEEAGRLDPGYARADLWRAQALHWDTGRRSGPDVLALAERAAVRRSALSAREELLVDGLLHLERGEYQEACATYARLRDDDASDFAAWYGLGKCREMDAAVVRDPGSPSGWAFRSSYQPAAGAYRRAFELLPTRFEGFSSQAFAHARDALYTSRSGIRFGLGPAPDRARFAAYPTLAGDTLAFVPYPIQAFGAGETPGSSPASHWAAVERQRRVFRDLTAGWLAAYPESPEALHAYSLTLDLLGDPATIDTLKSARLKAQDPALRHRLAVETVPRLIKYAAPDGIERLAEARALADSLFQSPQDPPPSFQLSAVAALTGRVFLAARLERQAAVAARFPVEIPQVVTAEGAALDAFAALGGPADSLALYERRVREAVRNRIPPDDRDAALHALLDRPALLAFPSSPLPGTAALAATSGFLPLKALAAYARGSEDEARALLPPLRPDPPGGPPAEKTPDVLFPEVWLAAQLGDTADAVAALDANLGAMRWIESRTLSNVALAGALVRAMALRADLAHATGDAETAARWARAVSVLWDGAPPPLEFVVSRMRTIAASPGTNTSSRW